MRIRLALLRQLIREQLTLESVGDPGHEIDIKYAGFREPGGIRSIEWVTIEDLFGGPDYGGILVKSPEGSRTVTTKNYKVEVFVPYVCVKDWPENHPLGPTGKTRLSWMQDRLAMFRPLDAADTLQHTFKVSYGFKGPGSNKPTGFRLNMRVETRDAALDVFAIEIAKHFANKGITAIAPVGSTSGAPEKLSKRVAVAMGKPFVTFDKEGNPIEPKEMLAAAVKLEKGDIIKDVYDLEREYVAKHGTIDGFPYKIPAKKVADLDDFKRNLQNKLDKGIKLTSSNIPPQFADYFPQLYKAGKGIVKGAHYLVVDDNIQTGRAFEHVNFALRDLDVKLSYAAGYTWPRSSK